MTRSEEQKLARYDWLCKAFEDAYHNDAIDSENPVSACLLSKNASYRMVQFVINIQEKTDTYVDLDSWVAKQSVTK